MEYEIIDKVLYIKDGVENVKSLELRGKQIEKIVIPDSVKTIGSFAFYKLGINEVVLGKNLEIIGNFAFASNNLQKVELNEGLKEIGAAAFQDNEIEKIELPNSITSINQGAFEDNKLTTVKLPPLLTSLEPSVFRRNRLTSIELNDKLTKIGGSAFAYNKIEKVDLKNVNCIGKDVFMSNKIEHIDLPKDIKKIDKGSFALNKLTSVTIPDSVVKIDEKAFAYNKISELNLGCNVNTINNEAFIENNLESLDLPDSLIKIGERAFMDNSIKSLKLPENLSSIATAAFMRNDIETLDINDNLEFIGEEAFYGNKLKNLKIGTKIVLKEAFYANPLELVEITKKHTDLRNDVFSTKEILIDSIHINNDILRKFNTIKLDKIIAFKKAVNDYNLMNVDKYELAAMPTDKDVFKQYKANHKKYMAVLEELGLTNNITYFKLAHLLGMFNNPKDNLKEFVLYTKKLPMYDLNHLMESYNISKYNKKLSKVASEFIYDEKNIIIFTKILENYNEIFDKISVYKKDQIAKNNTKKIKLEQENKDTTDVSASLDNLKKNLKTVSFGEIVEYFKTTTFDIREQNERLKEITLILSSYIKGSDFDRIQNIYENRTREDELYFKNFKGESNGLEYSWISSDDPTNFILGYLVNCCAKLNGAGQDIMVQSIKNPRIKNLAIKKDGQIIAKTTAYFNDDYLLCNNVEVKRGVKCKQEILDTLVLALKEQANHLGVSKVNVGLINNDLIEQIKINKYETIKQDLLSNYAYNNYPGDAFYEQAKLIKY